ncbi:hypothetical protein BGX23_008633 [Mortierella sp. AD031]|nr:hypothetical protein BGX23_008633 [Mortierella sp. AD031]
MAVTTRNRAPPAKPAATAGRTKKAAPAPKKGVKKAPAPVESESESASEDQDIEDDNSEDEEDESKDDGSDEDTFKIHTPKAAAAPRIAPAVLPTMTYEDDSEEEDSDEAPEAESLSSAKAKIQSAQDKEKFFLSKVQAEQKAKRVEREQKLKEQKDQSKAKKKAKAPVPAVAQEVAAPPASTTKSGLPTMLPMDILESVAEMDDSASSNNKTNDKKRKHMRPEDFALMELEAELRAEALKRKKAEKKQKNVGPVTVKVLDQSTLAQGHAIPETIVDFRKQHFYGSKILRKDGVLNMSQKNSGAAAKFHRRK